MLEDGDPFDNAYVMPLKKDMWERQDVAATPVSEHQPRVHSLHVDGRCETAMTSPTISITCIISLKTHQISSKIRHSTLVDFCFTDRTPL